MDSSAAFNAVDIVVAVFVLVCVVLGFRRGLIGQIAFLLTLAAVAAAVRFGYAPVRGWLAAHLTMDDIVLRVGALAIVVGIPLIAMMFVTRLLGRLREFKAVAGLDRLGGAMAGLFGALVFVVAAFLIAGALPARYRPAAIGQPSWVGRHLAAAEAGLFGAVTQRVDRTENALLKAREERTNRREKWEE